MIFRTPRRVGGMQWLIAAVGSWAAVVAASVAFGGGDGSTKNDGKGSPSPSANVVRAASSASAEQEGLRAFTDVASVLRHPRCLNCHPAGDVPRQTDARLPHFPPVTRGVDDRGAAGMRCTTCHQVENQLNGVPGAPGWSVAPRTMAWEALNDHDLAEQLKDPQRNGGRTLAQIVDHLNHERLVLWAWQPGGHRATPPLTHDQFVKRFEDWIAAGAPSPAPEAKGITP
ncbi:MAG TPA: hypothetical protein VFT72_14145 [Opitutaceae bacterium]|nr:hypothetical protein [Opitutaceae bacterium]